MLPVRQREELKGALGPVSHITAIQTKKAKKNLGVPATALAVPVLGGPIGRIPAAASAIVVKIKWNRKEQESVRLTGAEHTIIFAVITIHRVTKMHQMDGVRHVSVANGLIMLILAVGAVMETVRRITHIKGPLKHVILPVVRQKSVFSAEHVLLPVLANIHTA